MDVINGEFIYSVLFRFVLYLRRMVVVGFYFDGFYWVVYTRVASFFRFCRVEKEIGVRTVWL